MESCEAFALEISELQLKGGHHSSLSLAAADVARRAAMRPGAPQRDKLALTLGGKTSALITPLLQQCRDYAASRLRLCQ